MSQGVDPAGVLAFLDAVDADPSVELHGLMVLRHGHVVAEGWWAPHTAERTRLVYSLSKSFTSTALAFAVDEGLVDLDDTVLQHFPEYADEVTDPRSRSLTLRHLISMASGHDREMWPEAVARDREDPVRGFLLIPPDATPGSVRLQPALHLHRRSRDPAPRGAAAERVPRTAAPPAARDRPGRLVLHAAGTRTRLQRSLRPRRGRREARPALPPGRPLGRAAADARVVRRPGDVPGGGHSRCGSDKVDWSQGYGYGFWMSRHGYRGDGAYGQFCLVLPEQDAVVAITGGTEAMQTVLDQVWEHLLPSLGGGTEMVEDAHPRLVERLRTLRLPPCPGTPAPARWGDWSGTTFSVVDSSDGETASTLSSVAVKTNDSGVGITFHEPDNALTFAAGTGEWLDSEPSDASGDDVPVAASAGWIDDDTLRVEAIFLETPHRLDVECSLSTGTARATWRGTPLDGGRLTRLHRPG